MTNDNPTATVLMANILQVVELAKKQIEVIEANKDSMTPDLVHTLGNLAFSIQMTAEVMEVSRPDETSTPN